MLPTTVLVTSHWNADEGDLRNRYPPADRLGAQWSQLLTTHVTSVYSGQGSNNHVIARKLLGDVRKAFAALIMTGLSLCFQDVRSVWCFEDECASVFKPLAGGRSAAEDSGEEDGLSEHEDSELIWSISSLCCF